MTPPVAGWITSEAPFSATVTAPHWPMRYVKGGRADVPEVLEKYIREGEQLPELSVATRHSWLDNLLAGVTSSIYSPLTPEFHDKTRRVVAVAGRAAPGAWFGGPLAVTVLPSLGALFWCLDWRGLDA